MSLNQESKAKSPASANVSQSSPASQAANIKDADIGTKTPSKPKTIKALFASDDF